MSKQTPIVLLAAGSSSRLGHPKQLVMFQKKTLLQRAVDVCLGCDLGPLYVVTGAYRDKISKELQGRDVHEVYHRDWSKGMGSSISVGVRAAMQCRCEGLLIVISDQPYLTEGLLNKLVAEGQGKWPVLARYSRGEGPPAFFPRSLFPQLLGLNGDRGAKKIALQGRVKYVYFEAGDIDIDRTEDLEALYKIDE